MHLRKKIAQMILIGFDNTDQLTQWFNNEPVGGVIVFAKNIQDFKQISQLNYYIQSIGHCCDEHGNSYPPWIAIDHEGGQVDRFRLMSDYTPSLSALQQAQLPIPEQMTYFNRMAALLASLGFNLNLAPCVDLHIQKNTGVIGALGRSFGEDPQAVAVIAKRFIEAHAQYRVLCTLKHFPGHGSAALDTHKGFVDVTDHFQPTECTPYQLLCQNAQPFLIMTAHITHRALDSAGHPATLSYPMLQRLRQDIGFQGIIITDCMQMRAIQSYYPLPLALQLALQAGVDMFIFANQSSKIEPQLIIDTIEHLVNTKTIDESVINAAYQRIIHLKASFFTSIPNLRNSPRHSEPERSEGEGSPAVWRV